VVRHRSVVNFLASMAREPGLAAADVLVAVTTVSFDIAVLELFLRSPSERGSRSPIATRRPTGSSSRRSWRAPGDDPSGHPGDLAVAPGVRLAGRQGLKALCGGEALPGDLARELVARVGTRGRCGTSTVPPRRRSGRPFVG